MHKWNICESLWSEHPPEKAEQNLHTTVYRLKKTLSEHRLGYNLESRKGAYRLELASSCDYMEFDRQSAGLDKITEKNEKQAEQVLSLYKGPLFGSKDYAWCAAERERMLRQYSELIKKLSNYCMERGEYIKAAGRLRELLSQAPLDEEGHVLLLMSYLRTGDRSAFLIHYQQMRELFLAELGLEPRESIRQLYEQMVHRMF
jgi:two-component SAPR family response regulator